VRTFAARRDDVAAPQVRGERNRWTGIGDPKAATVEHFLVYARV
jgi:hypothetical protein